MNGGRAGIDSDRRRFRRWSSAVAAIAAASLIAVSSAQAVPISNFTPIAIPALGQANPYPSSIVVSNLGAISDLDVQLQNVSHTYPDDIEVAVTGPNGISFLLMDGAGGGNDLTGLALVFNDGAAAQMPDSDPIGGNFWKPAAHDTLRDFAAPGPLATGFLNPGPTAGGAAQLSAFNGSNPNGTWRLWVQDSSSGDSGQIAGGWTLDITASGPPQLSPPTDVAVSPASGSNQNNVAVIGLATSGATVSLFKSATCTGPVAATATAIGFGGGQLKTTVPDNSTTQFSVNQTNVNGASNCSAPVTYREVTPPAKRKSAPKKCKKRKKKAGAAAKKRCKKGKKRK
jgi:large repetitive protein